MPISFPYCVQHFPFQDEKPLTDSKPVSLKDVEFEDEGDIMDSKLILLNNDWHLLFEIAYYIQVSQTEMSNKSLVGYRF